MTTAKCSPALTFSFFSASGPSVSTVRSREGPGPRAHRRASRRRAALAGAIAAMLFTVPGIANKTLRGLITGLLNRPYSMSQASYDLSRLVRNGLDRPGPRAQPLHPDQRRAAVRLPLHPRLRPRPFAR